MIDFVLGHVEEHVGADGSRFSESILERWRHALDLELVGLVGNFLLVEQLPLLIVEQLPNLILFSIRVSMRPLADVEVTHILSRI